MGAAYPAHLEVDVVLRDGSTAHLRPVRVGDEGALLELFESLAPESRTFRFFSAATDLGLTARQMVEVDYVGRYGLVASRGGEGRLAGHATYVETTAGRAEVAFAVADPMQGLGLATLLLAHLAEVAHANGIAVFYAEVLPQNHRMIDVFRESGFLLETSSEPGSVRVEFPTSLSPAAVRRFQERDRIAAAAAVRHFLEPRTVAVVGASRRRGTVGGEIFHNLLASGFDGVVHPVNPATDVVQSVRAYRCLAEVPGEVELAVIAVPAEAVLAVARECGAKEVRAVAVISAGFAETGPRGGERQRELVEICRGAGMRLVGPNCLGVLNTAEGSRLNATFAPSAPPPGNVGFVTQSGALGLALIDLAADRGLGVSSFASIGNRADVTASDFLEYWEGNDATRVALLYIESFSEPRRFSRLARRIGREKPIVVVKSGRSVSGGRATSSHTGALLSASDVTVDALFAQAGVIRTETLSELLDVASLLSSQPLPQGPRVGIVTNAGGPGIMCADACEAAGLEVPELPQPVRGTLRGFLAAEASLANPVDLIATASAEQYRRAIATLAGWEGIDALIVIFIRPLLTQAEDVAEAVGAALAEMERPIPVQTVFMSPRDHGAASRLGGAPTHLYPEDAARALGRVMRHVQWRARPAREPQRLAAAREDEVAAVLADALARGREWLGMAECARLLDCYGIAMPGWLAAPDPAAAGEAAERLGGRVALKAEGPKILHKTEIGAVRVGLEGGEEVARAAAEMAEALAAAEFGPDAFIVQSMFEGGVELLVGVIADPLFGPVLACGAGGTQAELLKDVAVRVCPLGPDDGAEMIRSLAIFPLLTGFRGGPKVDLDSLEGLLLRLSAMVDSHHEVAEMDLNPVIAGPTGALAVDARIRVKTAAPPRPWPRTWV
ncbi:MAG: GNAT family N-acetyltransferase [Solirubrobacterales bacterium]